MFVILAVLVGFASLVLSTGVVCASTPLRTAAEVHRLSTDEARKRQPVSLRGTVTNVMPEWSGFSLQDATDAIYVSAGDTWTGGLTPGQVVAVEGRASPGNFAPTVIATRVRVLGAGRMPEPKRANSQFLSTGACDNEYVQVEGVVRSAVMVQPPVWEWSALALRIDLGGKLIWAYLRDPADTRQEGLVDATVRVRGICLVISNHRRQFQANSLLIPRSNDIEVVQPGPSDPFDAPLRPINRVFGFSPGSTSFHRVKVQGIATLQTAVQLYLQDDGEGVLVQSQSAPAVKPGDRVEAVGFPEAGAYSTVLEDAVVRVTGRDREPEAQNTKADAVLVRVAGNVPASPDAVLLRIEGRLLDRVRSAQGETLILQDGANIFSARLPGNRGTSRLSGMLPGSLLAITGVCSVQVDERGLPKSFELVMRSPADVRVLARGQWLTRTMALRLAAVLLGVVAAAAVWLVLLRRRVRKQTETIRRQLEREASLELRCRDLIENATDLVYTRDLEGHLLHVNRGAEQMTGYTRNELLEMNFIDLLVPEQRESARRHLQPDDGTDVSLMECRLIRKDGRELVVEIRQRFLVDDSRPTRVECIGRDVTARSQALLDNEERFRTLADNIPQLAWMADDGGSVFWYNRRWYEYTGTGIEEMQGWGWRKVHHPDHLDRVVRHFQHSLQNGMLWEDSFPLRGKDGQYRWFLSRAVPIRDDSGRVVRWFGTNTDITDQKRTEAALQRSNDDLQQFAYVASHDLQEPLRNISTFAELIERTFADSDLTPQRRKYMQILGAGAKRMEALISGLLTYARLAGDSAPVRQRVNLNDTLQQALANLRQAINEAGAIISHDSLPDVQAVPVQMVQVFQNLIGNSVKYRRPEVTPVIYLSAERHRDEWLFCVRDNGQGFSPEYAEKVFGIFKRLHTDISGTGIGLAICKTIIDRHGGRIWAVAKVGEGAAFFFTLPHNL